jgi:hypothetical protein
VLKGSRPLSGRLTLCGPLRVSAIGQQKTANL